MTAQDELREIKEDGYTIQFWDGGYYDGTANIRLSNEETASPENLINAAVCFLSENQEYRMRDPKHTNFVTFAYETKGLGVLHFVKDVA